MLPPLLDGMSSRQKIAHEIGLFAVYEVTGLLLEPLPVTQEVAGSSPVAPAKFLN